MSAPSRPLAVRTLVVAPTFDNAATLAGVLAGVLATGLDVLVVDDGCRDGTAAVLAGLMAASGDKIHVLTHPANRGKADALRSGFAWAMARGYTHAATIDTDAQHAPGDLLPLVALAESHPDALVLGVRDTGTPGYPAKNRFGRWVSNTLVRLGGGGRVADSQCGLRVYPLEAVTAAMAKSGRYGFETEILVRCGWAGVKRVEAPVSCVYELPGGRVSHYRPWRDTVRIAGLHCRLLSEASLRWLNPGPAWRAARRHPAERRRLAVALSAGVLIGNLPVYGLQTFLGILTAKKLKLQPLAVIAGTHVSTPPIGPVLIAAAIGTGHWLRRGTFLKLTDLDPARIGYFALLRRVAVDWTLGSIILGVVLALLTYAVVRLTLRVMPRVA